MLHATRTLHRHGAGSSHCAGGTAPLLPARLSFALISSLRIRNHALRSAYALLAAPAPAGLTAPAYLQSLSASRILHAAITPPKTFTPSLRIGTQVLTIRTLHESSTMMPSQISEDCPRAHSVSAYTQKSRNHPRYAVRSPRSRAANSRLSRSRLPRRCRRLVGGESWDGTWV